MARGGVRRAGAQAPWGKTGGEGLRAASNRMVTAGSAESVNPAEA